MCARRKTVRVLLKSQVTQPKPHPSLQHHLKSPLLHFQRNWTLWTIPQRISSVPWPLNFSSTLTWHFAVATTSPRELWLDWRARESHAPFAKSPTWPRCWTSSTDARCGQFRFAVPTLLEGVSGWGRWGSWVSTFGPASSNTQKHQYHDSILCLCIIIAFLRTHYWLKFWVVVLSQLFINILWICIAVSTDDLQSTWTSNTNIGKCACAVSISSATLGVPLY
jgi:hypothetical protein